MNLIEIRLILKMFKENGGYRLRMAKTRKYGEKGEEIVDATLDAIAKGDFLLGGDKMVYLPIALFIVALLFSFLRIF